MQHAMTTTAFTLDGYRITKTLGLVRGRQGVDVQDGFHRPSSGISGV